MVQTVSAELKTTEQTVFAYQVCSEHHLSVDLNVQSTKTAHRIELALIKSALILVLDHAASTLSVMYRTINRSATVSMAMKEILTLDVMSSNVST